LCTCYADPAFILLGDIESVETKPPTHQSIFQGKVKMEGDLAALMLTSGSTGHPKAVCLRHGQILSSLAGKSTHHGTTKQDVFLNWTGLDHVANLLEIHLHALSLAAQQVHVRGSDVLANPMSFLEKINSHSVTYTFAPNFFLAVLVRRIESLEEAHKQPELEWNSFYSTLAKDINGPSKYFHCLIAYG
jgi:acyl-CoA synthetase (AMP-forming)/AMP-acid ligase II